MEPYTISSLNLQEDILAKHPVI